jgi:hypothetical protein
MDLCLLVVGNGYSVALMEEKKQKTTAACWSRTREQKVPTATRQISSLRRRTENRWTLLGAVHFLVGVDKN